MNYRIQPIRPEHGEAVLDICDQYTQTSHSAYYTGPLPTTFFNTIIDALQDYPALVITTISDNTVVGFAFLRAHHPSPAFKQTAELRYFISPGHPQQGLGKNLLEHMIQSARAKGIAHLIATVSSLNSEGQDFHLKNGFTFCGRLTGIGRKFNQTFDVIYMQRDI